MQVKNQLSEKGLLAAVAIARGVKVNPSSEQLKSKLEQLVSERTGQEFPPQSVKDAVRNMLRTPAFKPTGRNKPASEYLAQAAREGRFPFINNLVDINNYVSLNTGLPISLLDADAFADVLTLRHGREGESYIFNAAGQEIDLHGLICACSNSNDSPLGNPIKDSITGKIKENTINVVGIIYSPSVESIADVAKTNLEIFAELLRQEGQAAEVETVIA